MNLSFIIPKQYHIKQISTVVSFAKEIFTSQKRDGYLYVDVPTLFQRGYFVELRKPAYKDKTMVAPSKNIKMILCSPTIFEPLFLNLFEKKEEACVGVRIKWVQIFGSPLFEVWEYNDYEERGAIRPLRFRITEKQRLSLLSFVRFVIQDSFSRKEEKIDKEAFLHVLTLYKQEHLLSLEQEAIFTQICGVDVAIWVDGELRGSQIVDGKQCLYGLYVASLRSTEDIRWKPIDSEDMSRSRIEVTLFGDLRVPLAISEIEKNEIYPEKGYCVTVNAKTGWYLPAVFNCRAFNGLQDFLTSLTLEKVGVINKLSPRAIFIFEVDDFIEDSKHTGVLALRGPIIEHARSHTENIDSIDSKVVGDFTKENIRKYAKRAFDYAIQIQKADGFFSVCNSPFTAENKSADWARSACLTHALALSEVTFTLGYEYKECVTKGYAYLKKYIYTHKTMTPQVRCLSLVYYYKAAYVLNDIEQMKKSHAIIISLLGTLQYEPIMYTNIALHIFNCGDSTDEEKKKAQHFAQLVLADFEHKIEILKNSKKINPSDTIDLASYADLPELLSALNKATGDGRTIKKRQEISSWYYAAQLADGSFPISPHSHFRYTRGTSKILESLSKEGLKSTDDVYKKTLSWLHSMQYGEEEQYYISNHIHDNLHGSFRHDYANATAWIDSTAHYLLALCYSFVGTPNKEK